MDKVRLSKAADNIFSLVVRTVNQNFTLPELLIELKKISPHINAIRKVITELLAEESTWVSVSIPPRTNRFPDLLSFNPAQRECKLADFTDALVAGLSEFSKLTANYMRDEKHPEFSHSMASMDDILIQWEDVDREIRHLKDVIKFFIRHYESKAIRQLAKYLTFF